MGLAPGPGLGLGGVAMAMASASGKRDALELEARRPHEARARGACNATDRRRKWQRGAHARRGESESARCASDRSGSVAAHRLSNGAAAQMREANEIGSGARVKQERFAREARLFQFQLAGL